MQLSHLCFIISFLSSLISSVLVAVLSEALHHHQTTLLWLSTVLFSFAMSLLFSVVLHVLLLAPYRGILERLVDCAATCVIDMDVENIQSFPPHVAPYATREVHDLVAVLYALRCMQTIVSDHGRVNPFVAESPQNTPTSEVHTAPCQQQNQQQRQRLSSSSTRDESTANSSLMSPTVDHQQQPPHQPPTSIQSMFHFTSYNMTDSNNNTPTNAGSALATSPVSGRLHNTGSSHTLPSSANSMLSGASQDNCSVSTGGSSDNRFQQHQAKSASHDSDKSAAALAYSAAVPVSPKDVVNGGRGNHHSDGADQYLCDLPELNLVEEALVLHITATDVERHLQDSMRHTGRSVQHFLTIVYNFLRARCCTSSQSSPHQKNGQPEMAILSITGTSITAAWNCEGGYDPDAAFRVCSLCLELMDVLHVATSTLLTLRWNGAVALGPALFGVMCAARDGATRFVSLCGEVVEEARQLATLAAVTGSRILITQAVYTHIMNSAVFCCPTVDIVRFTFQNALREPYPVFDLRGYFPEEEEDRTKVISRLVRLHKAFSHFQMHEFEAAIQEIEQVKLETTPPSTPGGSGVANVALLATGTNSSQPSSPETPVLSSPTTGSVNFNLASILLAGNTQSASNNNKTSSNSDTNGGSSSSNNNNNNIGAIQNNSNSSNINHSNNQQPTQHHQHTQHNSIQTLLWWHADRLYAMAWFLMNDDERAAMLPKPYYRLSPSWQPLEEICGLRRLNSPTLFSSALSRSQWGSLQAAPLKVAPASSQPQHQPQQRNSASGLSESMNSSVTSGVGMLARLQAEVARRVLISSMHREAMTSEYEGDATEQDDFELDAFGSPTMRNHSQHTAANHGSTFTTMKEFCDRRGARWRRTTRVLGRGAAGHVYLGQSEDGGFVAIKAVPIPRKSQFAPAFVSASSFSFRGGSSDGPNSPKTPTNLGATINAPLSPHSLALSSSTATAAPPPPQQPPPSAFLGASSSVVSATFSRVSSFARHAAQLAPKIDEFLREVGLLMQLKHRNIVQLRGCAVVGRYLNIIMELVSGGSLYALLEEYGVVPLSILQRYLKDILCGLAFLHERDIVHRDVKPHNVLVGNDGTCKLTDFGASANTQQMQAAGENVLIGTPEYMAPEQCRGEAVFASDIWSFGVTACQLATGALPWEDNEVARHLRGIQFAVHLGRDDSMRPTIPSAVPAVFAECLSLCFQRDPKARPTAEQLLSHPFFTTTLHLQQQQQQQQQTHSPPVVSVIIDEPERSVNASHPSWSSSAATVNSFHQVVQPEAVRRASTGTAPGGSVSPGGCGGLPSLEEDTSHDEQQLLHNNSSSSSWK
eukprot:PhM_4_TR15909/c0_g1_i1/m.57855